MPKYSFVTATSDANCYGITQDRWFDGKSETVKVIRRTHYDGTNNWMNVNELTITKINEVFNLHHSCSDESYYQCLAKRLAKFNFKEATDVVVNGSNCSFDKVCAPFSLPFDDAEKIPMCTSEFERTCHEQIISQKLKPDLATQCQKSCHVKEFLYRFVDERHGQYLPKGDTNKNDQELVIKVKFDTSQKSFWELRSLHPFKTVKTEYYIMTGLTFVGNVGGTLGMFAGFSFIGAAEWFFGSATLLWQWMERKDVVHLKGSIIFFRKSVWTLVCLCFLGGSISIVWPTLKEYHYGATSYTERQEPISLEDLPTIVSCLSFEDDQYDTFPPNVSLFPMAYEKDVVIYATIFERENKTVALLKDQHVQTLLGLDINLSELVLSRKPKWQCYKITTRGSKEVTADIQNLSLQMSFSFPNANKSAFEKNYNWEKNRYETGIYFNINNFKDDWLTYFEK